MICEWVDDGPLTRCRERMSLGAQLERAFIVPWEPAKLEKCVLDARDGRWTVSVYSAFPGEGCYWTQLVLRGPRSYDLLVRIGVVATLQQIEAALQRWLDCGPEPFPSVHVHTYNELPGSSEELVEVLVRA